MKPATTVFLFSPAEIKHLQDVVEQEVGEHVQASHAEILQRYPRKTVIVETWKGQGAMVVITQDNFYSALLQRWHKLIDQESFCAEATVKTESKELIQRKTEERKKKLIAYWSTTLNKSTKSM